MVNILNKILKINVYKTWNLKFKLCNNVKNKTSIVRRK